MQTALAIMRLQPMHRGHQFMIETMLRENDRVIVLVGSANKCDDRNPYTADMRMEMVRGVFPDEIANGKLVVGAINDLGNPPKWVEYVIQQIGMCPDVYYCGDERDGQLFMDAGISVRAIGRVDIPISATIVRDKIANNDPEWQCLVPAAVQQIIQK